MSRIQKLRGVLLLLSRELQELASGYGELTEFWPNGADSEGDIYHIPRPIENLRMYQPSTVVLAGAALFEYGRHPLRGQ